MEKNKSNDLQTDSEDGFSVLMPPLKKSEPENTGGLQVTTRFQPGVSGNPKGRPKGKKNVLTEVFMRTVVEDFTAYGAEALQKLREDEPATYFKLIAVILPKHLITKYEEETDYSQLSHEEVIELLNEIKHRRLIEKAIKTVSE